MSNSTDSAPNKGAEYKQAWDMLYPKLPESVREKVIRAQGSDNPAPEAVKFFKDVIALAEQGD
jgi:hypothetical protein